MSKYAHWNLIEILWEANNSICLSNDTGKKKGGNVPRIRSNYLYRQQKLKSNNKGLWLQTIIDE